MQPSAQWQFSSKPAAIDIQRILRESESPDREVIRLTVDGVVFTLASRKLARRKGMESQALGACTNSTKFDKEFGELRLTQAEKDHTRLRPWYEDNSMDVLIFEGDRAGELVGRVVTLVETF